jgi:membrane dipeptidase
VTATVPIIDCHSDIIIDVNRRRSQGEQRVFERLHLPALREGGVAASICTVGGDPGCLCPLGPDKPFESAVALLDTLGGDLAGSGGSARIAGSAEEVRRLISEDVYAIVPALEGAAPLGGDPARVEQFYALGVRVIGLTWNSRNEVAVGLHAGDGGLTAAGRDVLEAMARCGIAVDVSHASPATFWDVAKAVDGPFIASHANARSVHDHARNLDDDQLRALRDAGGLVGVVFYPAFVGPLPVSVDHVLDHVEFLVERVGIDCVGIGADFIDYALEELVADYVRHGVPYSEANFVFPEGVETCRSLSRIVEGMEARGFSPQDIRKVASQNILRVLSAVEERAA